MAIKIISKNKRAYHDYQINETIEAGIELQGTEVKSLRAGKVNLADGWVEISAQTEAWLMDIHIGLYEQGNRANHDERRPRRLLLHKHELKKLRRAVQEQGFSIIPTKIYFKNSRIKLECGLGKGKKLHDKRNASRDKDAKRDVERALRQHS